MSYQLEDWSVVPSLDPNPYCAPRRTLRGRRNGETEFVNTSEIVHVDGKQVTTMSGSVYILGTPDPAYVAWCRDNACYIPTDEVPIKCR